MRLFLDTANIHEIRQGVELGVISGATTNPSLIAKERGVPYRERVIEIADLVQGPVSAECLARTADELVREAREIASWHPNVVVKVPMDAEGLKAIRTLSAEGILINTTLIFSSNQALLAATAGATYVSPFVGRLDDIGEDGIALVREIVEIFDRYHLPTQVLAASLRHPRHVTEAARAGAHIATMPFSVLNQMLKHPLTDIGIERFIQDYADAQQYLKASVETR
ncbi:MAG TPA: fructose-6-phosphate aldolase [Dehalococcoidia bacterium]|nr:fructose-6-phosphate aldolase [Dehalococcoidia bacterium]